ncbi:MAG: type IX secretion system sortase PorU [Bacteroidetes bacterium]|nr:MAG: type IX secretion system sortase PorU [Bacteroidota bacterium]
MKKLVQILTFSLFFLPTWLCAQKGKDSYSNSSELATGVWFKIAVTSDGIYRIDYSMLKQIGLTNPSNPRIFGNNWGQLSYYNNDPKPDDLKELAIYTCTGSDDIFNEGDYLLFYGKGTNKWLYNDSAGEYDFIRHNYSDTAFYFITSGTTPGKRVTDSWISPLPVNYSSSESDALYLHELESENLIKSGREWFQPVSTVRGIAVNSGFDDINIFEKMKFEIRVAARATLPTIFRFYEGESVKKSIQIQGVNIFNTTGTYANIVDSTGSFYPGSASPQYEIRFYNNGEAGAKGWIDWVKLQGRKSNIFRGPATQYVDSRSVGPGRITQFNITSMVTDSLVWDITDPLNVRKIRYKKNGNDITFKATTDSLKTFIAFTPANVLTPVIKSTAIPNQNLHSSGTADMIIITHPLFRKYAEKLADIHLKNNGLISQVVNLEQVYNEFSGGIPDIAAIRNFVRMKYSKQLGSNHPLKYLLLFGDGSYENKTLPPHNPNFIPTYQSENSNLIVSSFTSDDFYGLLEDGDGEADGTEDIGIGRLPVSDTTQASDMLVKINRYLDPANMGDWRNIISITADDEDGNIHMSDAEGLASLIKDSVPSFNVDKIYLDAFKQTTNVNGQSYPDVNKAINDRMNSGCLIFNYIGHGSESGLAHERVVKIEDINSWENRGKLPLFITATCEFSRFDDIEINIITREMTEKTSAGEMVLLNKEGGAIALMSTTRVVYSAPNYFLNRNIYNSAFKRDESGNSLCLGDIIRIAKNKSGSGPNKRNFTLLGDPALKLAYPWHGQVITDSINNVSVSNNLDSLKALSMVTVSGHIEDPDGKLINNFSGVVSPLVYDKESKIKTLANDGGQVMEFNVRNNVLFSGKTMAKEGKFRYSFIVPRDIDYSFGTGKISYYANNDHEDMNGNFTKIVVGGFSDSAFPDTSGPDIKLFMNDTLFRNGGITDNNPRLLAIIQDKAGINTTGSGIGHDLTAFLDNDANNSFVLNNYFENDFDNYMKGRLLYDLTGLKAGNHTLTLKAWDNYNNSSAKSILFLVDTGEKFVLKNLLNYPNPFLNETSITAEHNRPESELDITINIFNLDGRTVKILKTKVTSTGYSLPPIIWDGNDDGGKRVGRGIYPYTVIVVASGGETTRTSGRMIIL